MRIGAALICVAWLAAGCSVFVAKETLYLESAEGHATLEDVQHRLGQPKIRTSSPGGDPVWVYEIYWQDPSTQNSWGAPGTWCDEYVLTFDRQGILRRWTHKSEGHGGELSPTYCVTDGFKSRNQGS